MAHPIIPPRTLHVVIATTPTQEEGEERPWIHGAVYHQANLFSRTSPTAERHYERLFAPGQNLLVIVIPTDKGIGEWIEVFQEKFGVHCDVQIGGLISPFRLVPSWRASFWSDLSEKYASYFAPVEQTKSA